MADQIHLPGTAPQGKVEQMTFDLPSPQPIKGFPELRWAGKRPFTSTHYFPAQLKERYGDPVDGWMNRIYWGDNLQVMSHLLKEFRGKVDLVYIDPPFDSKADYRKKISLKGESIESDQTTFEEKQYTDIWSNDEYLQYMYERLTILKELISPNGSIYIHCDWRKSHLLRSILDEIFGYANLKNEISWTRTGSHNDTEGRYGRVKDTILFYSKSKQLTFNTQYIDYEQSYIDSEWNELPSGRFWKSENMLDPRGSMKEYDFHGTLARWRTSPEKMEELWNAPQTDVPNSHGRIKLGRNGFPIKRCRIMFLDEMPGVPLGDNWTDISYVAGGAGESHAYPTQKPEKLLERILLTSSNLGSLVLDCFMGSGTTQAVAMKLGRRFIGADINLGAIQTTTKRLNSIITEKKQERRSLLDNEQPLYLNFEVYNVNNYDVFRNPVQAKELLIQALEIDPLDSTDVFDGMKDGYKVKIMPVNRIASRADLNPIISGLNYRELDRAIERSPGKAAERIMLVCMGHEPDLAAHLKMEVGMQYRIEVEVVDILREKERGLTFKYDSEAEIAVENEQLVIKQFYPRNLLQKLSILDENVNEWRELVEAVAIDWNYNGEVLQPAVYDSPGKKELVLGRYPIPGDHGIIRVKITDLLSESLEMTVEAGQ